LERFILKSDVEQGLRIAAAAQVTILVPVVVNLFPTRDIRARVPILMSGLSSLNFVLWVLLVLIGILGVSVIRKLNMGSALGCFIAGFIVTAVFSMGIPRYLPEFGPTSAWLLSLASILGFAGFVVWERKKTVRPSR
jgi:hypothetical protein